MFSLSVNRSAFRVLLVAGVLLAGSILAMTMFNSAFAQDSGAIMYPENGTDPVATYTAVDPEQTAIVSWSLGGDDADDFKIDDGVLNFKKSPNFEMATMADTDNMYSVTVQATDETNKVGMKDGDRRGHQRGRAWDGEPCRRCSRSLQSR